MYTHDMASGHAVHEYQSCADTQRRVHWSDLPLACPMLNTTLWDAHPRIYLPIESSGREACPYCGTVYLLQEPEPDEPVPKFANAMIEKLYWRAVEQRSHTPT